MVLPVIDSTQKNRTSIKSGAKQIIIDADEEVVEIFSQTEKFLSNMWTMEMSNPLMMWMNPRILTQLFGKQCTSK